MNKPSPFFIEIYQVEMVLKTFTLPSGEKLKDITVKLNVSEAGKKSYSLVGTVAGKKRSVRVSKEISEKYGSAKKATKAKAGAKKAAKKESKAKAKKDMTVAELKKLVAKKFPSVGKMKTKFSKEDLLAALRLKSKDSVNDWIRKVKIRQDLIKKGKTGTAKQIEAELKKYKKEDKTKVIEKKSKAKAAKKTTSAKTTTKAKTAKKADKNRRAKVLKDQKKVNGPRPKIPKSLQTLLRDIEKLTPYDGGKGLEYEVPKSSLLKMKDLPNIKNLILIGPQAYNRAEYIHSDEIEYFFDSDGLAVTGGGSDPWIKYTPALDAKLKKIRDSYAAKRKAENDALKKRLQKRTLKELQVISNTSASSKASIISSILKGDHYSRNQAEAKLDVIENVTGPGKKLTKEEGWNAFSTADKKKMKANAKKAAAKPKKEGRKAPEMSATEGKVGLKMEGNDGEMWVIKKDKNDRKAWRRV